MNTEQELPEALAPEGSIYEQLRSDIIQARLSPGQKLKVEYLRRHYGTSGSPLREALNRLTAEGLVDQQDRRGFRVAQVSLEELEELTRARVWVEALAIRESVARGDSDWEAAVLLSYHRLSRAPSDASANDKRHPHWTKYHREFHRALLSACGSRYLLNFAALLSDSAERYREVAAGAGNRNHQDEHRQLMEAALDRDADRASQLITDHINKTAQSIIAIFHR